MAHKNAFLGNIFDSGDAFVTLLADPLCLLHYKHEETEFIAEIQSTPMTAFLYP